MCVAKKYHSLIYLEIQRIRGGQDNKLVRSSVLFGPFCTKSANIWLCGRTIGQLVTLPWSTSPWRIHHVFSCENDDGGGGGRGGSEELLKVDCRCLCFKLFYNEYEDLVHRVLILKSKEKEKTKLKSWNASCFRILIRQRYNLYYFKFTNQVVNMLWKRF